MEAQPKIPGLPGLPLALVRVLVGSHGQFGREQRSEENFNWESKSSEHRERTLREAELVLPEATSALCLRMEGSWEEPEACCLEGPVWLAL